MLKELAQNLTTTPVALATALDSAVGRNTWIAWEIEELAEQLNLTNPQYTAQLDKAIATQVVLTNTDAQEDWDLFNHVVVAFNNRRCHFEFLDCAEPAEIAWAVKQIRQLRHDVKYSEEVVEFIRVVCKHAGLVYFPPLNLCCDAKDVELYGMVKKVCDTGALETAEPELNSSEAYDSDGKFVQLNSLAKMYAYIKHLEQSK